MLYLAAEAIVLLTLALVLGSRLPGIAAGAIVVVVFGLTWVAGVMGAIGAFFDTPALVEAAAASRFVVPIDGLWRGAVYSLEPQAVLAVIQSETQIPGQPVLRVRPADAGLPRLDGHLDRGACWRSGVWFLRRREI